MNSEMIKETARHFGADLVGITSLDRFEGVAPENDPRSIFPQGKSMIVIGKRILRGALRGVENGGLRNGLFEDFGLYKLEDVFLSKATYDLVIWMENYGFEAVPLFCYDPDAAAKIPLGSPVSEGKAAPNVYVNWQNAAHLCGLGEVGKNGIFITPEFGTLQRFAMLITDAELEPDEILIRNVCEGCDACKTACPLDDRRCGKCTTGAVQTDIGRFETVDKIAAACGRACLASLESRDLITRKFSTAFRSRDRVSADSNCNEVK